MIIDIVTFSEYYSFTVMPVSVDEKFCYRIISTYEPYLNNAIEIQPIFFQPNNSTYTGLLIYTPIQVMYSLNL